MSHALHASWKGRQAAAFAAKDLKDSNDSKDIPLSTRDGVNQAVGRAVCSKARRRAREGGFEAAARQLRKQGFGLLVARLILLGRG